MNIHPLLDKEKQVQAQKYEQENRLLGLAESTFTLILLLYFYFSGFSNRLANLAIGNSIIWTFIVYITIFQMTLTLIGLPLSFYSGYIHEHAWGFSNHTIKSWFWDKIKSFLLGLILTPLLVGLLFWVMAIWPEDWWWIAGGVTAFVSVIFATLFPILILPLFNKYDPIENDELTNRLKSILEKAGLKPGGFFKQDLSRQTKKENAFLAGIGKTRRVVLADNLINNMDIPEIESVIAHEVGHYKYKHIWKNIAIGTVQQLIVFFVLNWVMLKLCPHFLESTRWNLTYLPIFAILMGVISVFLFGPLSNAISRYFERQADGTSLEMIIDKQAFLAAMAGLANRNLSNAYPRWWVKILYYSHPPIGERLAFAEEYGK